MNIALFQAQRNNEDVEAIKPLFSVNVEHRVSTVLTACLQMSYKHKCIDISTASFDSNSAFSLFQGAWSGPWVSSEVFAAVVGIVLYYLAYSTKSSIQA